jgi:hypothetical protein
MPEEQLKYLLDKARNFCDYQERTLFEVHQKLKSWSVSEANCT